MPLSLPDRPIPEVPDDASEASGHAPSETGAVGAGAAPTAGAAATLADEPVTATLETGEASAASMTAATVVSSKRKRTKTGGLAAPEAQAPVKPAALPKTVDKLAKLGLKSDIDLVLHLPMRYEDETTIVPVGELIPGDNAQTEGVIVDNEIAFRPRRQLLVKLHDDAGDELVLRFLNFYGSQVKQMAVGSRLRVRGDVRGGFFGIE